jgi:DNA-binding MarR family transcriptional regulator
MNADNKTEVALVTENLTSILPLLAKSFTKALRTKTNFTPGALYTLGALMHHEKLTMSGIGCHLSIPKPGVTAVVDKLIADELVERMNDPNDRRIIFIHITDKGRAMFKTVKQIVGEEIQQKLQTLDASKLAILLESSQAVREILVGLMLDVQPGSGEASCKG